MPLHHCVKDLYLISFSSVMNMSPDLIQSEIIDQVFKEQRAKFNQKLFNQPHSRKLSHHQYELRTVKSLIFLFKGTRDAHLQL